MQNFIKDRYMPQSVICYKCGCSGDLYELPSGRMVCAHCLNNALVYDQEILAYLKFKF